LFWLRGKGVVACSTSAQLFGSKWVDADGTHKHAKLIAQSPQLDRSLIEALSLENRVELLNYDGFFQAGFE